MTPSYNFTQTHQNAKLGFYVVDSSLLNIPGPNSSIPARKFFVTVLATKKNPGSSNGFMDEPVAHVAHAS
jgi:hypothetical protein